MSSQGSESSSKASEVSSGGSELRSEATELHSLRCIVFVANPDDFVPPGEARLPVRPRVCSVLLEDYKVNLIYRGRLATRSG